MPPPPSKITCDETAWRYPLALTTSSRPISAPFPSPFPFDGDAWPTTWGGGWNVRACVKEGEWTGGWTGGWVDGWMDAMHEHNPAQPSPGRSGQAGKKQNRPVNRPLLTHLVELGYLLGLGHVAHLHGEELDHARHVPARTAPAR